MDDERKKFPRKNGPKPTGARGGKPGFGKPGAGGKPYAAGGKKPFVKRGEGAPAGERPKRDFKSGERPAASADARADKPFRKGPPRDGDRKPFVKREEGERKPYVKRADSADRKPYVKREGAAPVGEPPRREFKREDDGARKPFVKREDGDRKPYVKRADSTDRKPYVKREGAAPAGERPKREFKRDEPRGDKPFRPAPRGDRPYSPGTGAKPFFKRDGEQAPERRERSFDRPQGERKPFGRPKPDGFKPSGDRKPFARAGEAAEPGERIAKRLARAGIASRRDAEELIAAGRIKVNGQKLTSPAFNVMQDDLIELDGTTIPPIERTRLFLFHKPAGVVTTNRDPEGRKTVFDVLPADLPRLMTIGRLDINTEGLLLLTNDGGLSRVLELPATGWLRRYRVRVHGKVDEKALPGLKDGLAVDGVFYGSIEATLDREQGSNAWMTIGLREGKNREVKNILGALGLEVSRLIRLSYGPFQLGELAEGQVQEVNGRMLRDQLGERLIEESGANFEAAVINEFSNQPVRRAPEPREEQPERPKIMRDGERGRIGEGGLIKNRKRRENTRDDALGKLSTSRPERPKFERGEKPPRIAKFGERPDRFVTFADKTGADKAGPKPAARGKKPEREQRPIDPPGARKANVWMAPGSRPIGTGRAAAEKAEVDAKKERRAGFKPSGGKPSFGKPRGDRPGGDRPRSDGPKGPRKGGGSADRRR